jgi:hypothetical protein
MVIVRIFYLLAGYFSPYIIGRLLGNGFTQKKPEKVHFPWIKNN